MDYWETCWEQEKIEDLRKYLNAWENGRLCFLEVFKKYQLVHICDAACGFGAMSVMLLKNGYEVDGFDCSKTAVRITEQLLQERFSRIGQYKRGDMTKIPYESERFDGVVAHAVIDHMTFVDACTAFSELKRITRAGGLIYLSFDPVEKEDQTKEHIILEDGTFQYTGEERKGMLFHPYDEQEVRALAGNNEILVLGRNPRGELEIIIRKEL